MEVVIAAALASLALTANVRLECPDAYTFAAESQTYTGDSHHGGVFISGERRVILRNDVCTLISELATMNWAWPPQLYAFYGWSVFTFAHELAHAAGVVDETRADCAAARTYQTVAVALAIPVRIIRRMMVDSAPFDGYDPAAIKGCWPRLMTSRAT